MWSVILFNNVCSLASVVWSSPLHHTGCLTFMSLYYATALVYCPGGTVDVLENSILLQVTLHVLAVPCISPGCSRHSGCCWAMANSQSERRRVPLTAVMLMKSSPLLHQTFLHIFPLINGYDVTSQVERPSALGRVLGYFCQGSMYTHTSWLEEFPFSKGEHETFYEVKAKMSWMREIWGHFDLRV